MAQAGYGVTPEVLTEFAGTLDGTADEVRAAAGRIGAANAFNFEAFGFLLGQVLAVPSRIALAVVKDKVDGAASGVSDDAGQLRTTADGYRTNENVNAQTFDSGQG